MLLDAANLRRRSEIEAIAAANALRAMQRTVPRVAKA
jgi:hypothetical protein